MRSSIDIGFHPFSFNVVCLALWFLFSIWPLFLIPHFCPSAGFISLTSFIAPSLAPGTHSESSVMCIFLYSPSLSVILFIHFLSTVDVEEIAYKKMWYLFPVNAVYCRTVNIISPSLDLLELKFKTVRIVMEPT